MSTIITGASGCIGRNLIVHLAKKSKDKIYVVYNSDKTFKGFLKKKSLSFNLDSFISFIQSVIPRLSFRNNDPPHQHSLFDIGLEKLGSF